jgi:DinB superfamily
MEIKKTCTALLQILDAFSEDEFNTVPPCGGWTPGQVAEHLLLSAGVVEVISGRTAAATRPPDEKVAGIAGIFLDFTTKLSSPPFIVPAEREYSKTEMITRLRVVWTKLAEAVKLLDLSVVCLDFEFPGSGTLTRLEWINFYIFHTQRHIAQLHRIYASLRKQDAPVAQ